MIDLLPSLFTLIVTGVVLTRLAGQPVLQSFISIVTAYVVFFPALDFIFSLDPPLQSYSYNQVIFAIFFFIPLVLFVLHKSSTFARQGVPARLPVVLNPIAPIFLITTLVSFIAIAYFYDLYLIRINYTQYNVTTNAPTVFLMIYRLILETSFFAILFLIYAIKMGGNRPAVLNLYRVALSLYLAVFSIFFLVNSRMQLVVLLIVLFITWYRPNRFTNRQVAIVAVSIIPLVLLVTILREVYIEQTGRLDPSNLFNLFRETIALISRRLNSVIMIDQASDFGTRFQAFSVDMSGLLYFIDLNTSYFTNPELYADLRESQITSPSVYVINAILRTNYVDFPKSMIVDVFLTFGALGLPFFAYILASLITFVQKHVKNELAFDYRFIIAIYMLPLMLQFEKEFLGFISFFIKWSPMLLVLLVLRPKVARPTPAVVGPNARNEPRYV